MYEVYRVSDTVGSVLRSHSVPLWCLTNSVVTLFGCVLCASNCSPLVDAYEYAHELEGSIFASDFLAAEEDDAWKKWLRARSVGDTCTPFAE